MPARLAGDVSDGYRWTPAGFERRDYEFIGQIAPAGSASSTAGDMARYMLMQLGGGQFGGATIYGPATAQAFRTPAAQHAGRDQRLGARLHGLRPARRPPRLRPRRGDAVVLLQHGGRAGPEPRGLHLHQHRHRPAAGRTACPDRIVAALLRRRPTPSRAPGSPELAQRRSDVRRLLPDHPARLFRARGLRRPAERRRRRSASPATGQLVTSDGAGVKTWVPEGPLDEGRFIASQGERAAGLRSGRRRRAAPSTSPAAPRCSSARRSGASPQTLAHPGRAWPPPRRWRPSPASWCATAANSARTRSRAAPAWSRTSRRCSGWLSLGALRPLGLEDRRPGPDDVPLAGRADDHRLGLRPGGRGADRHHAASRCRRSGAAGGGWIPGRSFARRSSPSPC